MAIIHLNNCYKICPRAPSGDEKRVKMTFYCALGRYLVDVEKTGNNQGKIYTIYSPSVESPNWQIETSFRKFIVIDDPQLLWRVDLFEKKIFHIELLTQGALVTTALSIALLACRFFGWIEKGHWALYLALTITSAVAYKYWANSLPQIQFDIANRIYSVFDLMEKKVQKIDSQTELLLSLSNYSIHKK